MYVVWLAYPLNSPNVLMAAIETLIGVVKKANCKDVLYSVRRMPHARRTRKMKMFMVWCLNYLGLEKTRMRQFMKECTMTLFRLETTFKTLANDVSVLRKVTNHVYLF
jgi:hypothetical protein